MTYVPTICPARGEDEDWTATTVVMEAPEALAAFRTLVPVTEVSAGGQVTDGVRLGAVCGWSR